jgi:hypothetical protein
MPNAGKRAPEGGPRSSRGNGHAISRDLNPRLVPAESCKPLGHETRKHPPEQVRKLAGSLDRFGFVLPILTDSEGRVIAGWGLLLAARELGLACIPAICLTDLSEGESRALRLALNRMTEDSEWDAKALALEFSEIKTLAPHLELEATGFEIAEIELMLNPADSGNRQDLAAEPQAAPAVPPVSRLGDLWILGAHTLMCGDPRALDSYNRVLGGEKAQIALIDPQSEEPVGGTMGEWEGLVHSDRSASLGDLSPAELRNILGQAAACSADGALHFVCTHPSRIREMLSAGDAIYGALESLCVWDKQKTRPGSLYASQYELVFVFRVGNRPRISNVRRGRQGGKRSDVWRYHEPNGSHGKSESNDAQGATARVAMIADAMRDGSKRGGLILDPFGGAGATLIAAEQTGRRARVIERDPRLVDLSIERWQRLTGAAARHAPSGQPFPQGAGSMAHPGDKRSGRPSTEE